MKSISKKNLKNFEVKKKYASFLTQFYMTLNSSKNFFTHLAATFRIFKIFSGTKGIQRMLNQVIKTVSVCGALNATMQLNVQKKRECQILCSRRILIAYGAI